MKCSQKSSRIHRQHLSVSPIPSISKSVITSESVRAYPKKIGIMNGKKERKLGKYRIYTDSPERNKLEEFRL